MGRSGFLPASEMLRPRSLKPAFACTVAACTRPMPAFVWSVCSPRLGRSGTRCRRGILPGAFPASQYPRKLSKALAPGLQGRCHPTGERPWRHCRSLHFSPPPARTSGSSQSSALPRDPPRSVPPVRAAALAPGAGRRRPSPASAIRAALARAARLDGPARPRATRGPVARGRAGRRRRLGVRGPTASAILDAAAAAVSASSCVFAACCRFARPRRQRGHTGVRGRKRKEETWVECRRPEPERRGRCRAGRRSSEGARAGPSPAADPPRRPPSCSLRPPRGHAGASPALRSVACPPCSAASWARRPPALPHAPRRPPPLPSPGPGPLRRQHGGREDLQQRGSYRSPASRQASAGPGLACRARARAAVSPRVGRRRPGGREAGGRGTARAPPRAGQGRGRVGGRAGGGPEAGPVPEAAAPSSRVCSPEAWSAHPQPVALQGLNCCGTSLCRSSRVIEEADTRMRGLGEDPRGGDPKSRYT